MSVVFRMMAIDTLSVNSVNFILPPTIKPGSSSAAPLSASHSVKTKCFANHGVLRGHPLNCDKRRRQTKFIHCSKQSLYQGMKYICNKYFIIELTN